MAPTPLDSGRVARRSGPAGEGHEALYLSLADAHLVEPGESPGPSDHILLVTLFGESDELTRTAIVGPERLRSRATRITSGLLIAELPLAPIPPHTRGLAAMLYRVRRDDRAQRVIEAIEGAAAALDYERNPRGSLRLAETILDRIELLAQRHGATPLLGASYELDRADASDAWPPYLALGVADSGDDGRALWVKEGQLCAGRSLESSAPIRQRSYLLLRTIAGPATGAPNLSTFQLWLQHTLSGGGAPLEARRAEVANYLERETRRRQERQLVARFGRRATERLPVVTPLALEVAANLEPLVSEEGGGLAPAFQSQIASMREELRFALGVEAPHLRVRGNVEDMPDDTYLIMLREVPLVMGTIDPAGRWCERSVDALARLGIAAVPATDPLTGDEVAWVAESDWQLVRDAQIELYDPSAYIAVHLGAVVTMNIGDLIGIDTIGAMLRERDPELSDRIGAAPGGLAQFADVVRALLEERAPVRELQPIGARYLELAGAELPAYAIVEELRLLDAIRSHLVGNKAGTAVYRLGRSFVELLASKMVYDRDTAVLAMEPELCQDALAAIRVELSARPTSRRPVVMVVDDWQLRPFVRLLVELEFPHLHVLAERELVAPAEMPTLATIELD